MRSRSNTGTLYGDCTRTRQSGNMLRYLYQVRYVSGFAHSSQRSVDYSAQELSQSVQTVRDSAVQREDTRLAGTLWLEVLLGQGQDSQSTSGQSRRTNRAETAAREAEPRTHDSPGVQVPSAVLLPLARQNAFARVTISRCNVAMAASRSACAAAWVVANGTAAGQSDDSEPSESWLRASTLKLGMRRPVPLP